MAVEIPFYKYCNKYFPETPKSTLNYWAKRGLQGEGEFAGRITRHGCRYYLIMPDEQQNARMIAQEILTKIGES